MKKAMSLCLVLILVFCCISLPVYANEAETITPTRQIYSGEDALELACQV